MATKRNLIIKTKDTNGNEMQMSVPYVNPESTAQQVDTFSRALNSLSTDIYRDTLIVDTKSVNEELAD